MAFNEILYSGTGQLSSYILILNGSSGSSYTWLEEEQTMQQFSSPPTEAALFFPPALILPSSFSSTAAWFGSRFGSRMLCAYQFATVHPFAADFPGVYPALPAGGWESCNFLLGGLLPQHALTKSDFNFHWLRTWFWEKAPCTPGPNVFHLIREKANELVMQDSNFLMFNPILPFGRSLSQATAD